MNKAEIVQLLHINGVSPQASDEEVRVVLLNANYTEEETAEALQVLRQRPEAAAAADRSNGLYRIFRADLALQPQEIKALLGIDIEVKEAVIPGSKARKLSVFQAIILFFVVFAVASGGVLMYMYLHQFGVFHPTLGIL